MKGVILVDLDGTLAHDRGVRNWVGEPIMPMVLRVQNWIQAGYEVRIFTARVAPDEDETRNLEATRQMIGDWSEQVIGTRLSVTCIKDRRTKAIYDDRAWRVETNTGRILGEGEDGT